MGEWTALVAAWLSVMMAALLRGLVRIQGWMQGPGPCPPAPPRRLWIPRLSPRPHGRLYRCLGSMQLPQFIRLCHCRLCTRARWWGTWPHGGGVWWPLSVPRDVGVRLGVPWGRMYGVRLSQLGLGVSGVPWRQRASAFRGVRPLRTFSSMVRRTGS